MRSVINYEFHEYFCLQCNNLLQISMSTDTKSNHESGIPIIVTKDPQIVTNSSTDLIDEFGLHSNLLKLNKNNKLLAPKNNSRAIIILAVAKKNRPSYGAVE